MQNKTRPPLERFFESIIICDGECWQWIGVIDKRGYGRFTIRSDKWAAHRWSYQQFTGESVEGAFVCHACDNPSCVNPDHLFLGTHADNMADMVSKGRQQHGETHRRAKLTTEQVGAIRASAESICVLARRYEVAESCIYNIRKGTQRKNG